MTGFLVFVLVPLWVALCMWLASQIGDLFTGSPLRLELKLIIFIALLPTVVVDELFAKPQFDELCSEKAVLTIHAEGVIGRLAYVTDLPPEPIPGMIVPVHLNRRLYADERTHQPLVSLAYLRASGGKLAKALRGPAAVPLTFRGLCAPEHWTEPLRALALKVNDAHDLNILAR